MTKKEGFVEFGMALMVLMMMAFTLKFTLDSREMKLVDEMLTDSLTSAVLASAVVDLDEYGTTNEIVIDREHRQQSSGGSPVNGLHVAYNNFLDALKVNLGNTITSEELGINGTQIIREIVVQEFSVFNELKNGQVYKISVDSALFNNKVLTTAAGANGVGTYFGDTNNAVKPTTPDGEIIIGTTVYVNIVYKLYNFQGEPMLDKDNSQLMGSRDYKIAIYEEVE